MNLVRVAVETATSAKIAVLMLPGIGVKDDLRRAAGMGAQLARIATHCTEADIAEQHIALGEGTGHGGGGVPDDVPHDRAGGAA